jgi:hypothetical protein
MPAATAAAPSPNHCPPVDQLQYGSAMQQHSLHQVG